MQAKKQINEFCKKQKTKWENTKKIEEENKLRKFQKEEMNRVSNELNRLRNEYKEIMAKRGLAHQAAQLINEQDDEMERYSDRMKKIVSLRAKKTLLEQQKENLIKEHKIKEEKQRQIEKRKQLMKRPFKWDDLDDEDFEIVEKLIQLNQLEADLKNLIKIKKQNKSSENTQTKRNIKFNEKIETRKNIKPNENKIQGDIKTKNPVQTIPKRIISPVKQNRQINVSKIVERKKSVEVRPIQTKASCQTKEFQNELMREAKQTSQRPNDQFEMPATIATKVLQKLKQTQTQTNQQTQIQTHQQTREPNIKRKVFRSVAINTVEQEVAFDGLERSLTDSTLSSYLSLPPVQANRNGLNRVLGEIKNTIIKRVASVESLSLNSTSSLSVVIEETESTTNKPVQNDKNGLRENHHQHLVERLQRLKKVIDFQLKEASETDIESMNEREKNLIESIKNNFTPSPPTSLSPDMNHAEQLNNNLNKAVTPFRHNNSLINQENLICNSNLSSPKLFSENIAWSPNVSSAESSVSSSFFKTLPAIRISSDSPLKSHQVSKQIFSPISKQNLSILDEDLINDLSDLVVDSSFNSNNSLSFYEKAIISPDRNEFFKNVFLKAGVNISEDKIEEILDRQPIKSISN